MSTRLACLLTPPSTRLSLQTERHWRFAKGDGRNEPKYYTTYGGSIRFYPSNVLTITASKPIASITIDCVDNGKTYNASGDLEVSAGSLAVSDESVGITAIGSNELVLRNTSTTTGDASILRIKSMIITYAE